MIDVMSVVTPTRSPGIAPSPIGHAERGSRIGDVRIRRERPEHTSVFGKIAARLRGVLAR